MICISCSSKVWQRVEHRVFSADKKKLVSLLALPYSYVRTVRNLTRRPEACDAVVKTIRYNRRNCGPIWCLDNSRWVYLSTRRPVLPFISRGPRNMRTIYAAHDCRRGAKDPRTSTGAWERKINPSERWLAMGERHEIACLCILKTNSGRRTRYKVVAGYQTCELKRSFWMQISLIERKR